MNMEPSPVIQVRSTGRAPWGAHWSYGASHQQRISRASAVKLLRAAGFTVPEAALPRMGYERDLLIPSFTRGLMLQNAGGDYYLASVSHPTTQWAESFGVEVEGPKE